MADTVGRFATHPATRMLPIDAPPQLPSAPVEMSVTAERVDVGNGVHMGLTGLHYQRLFTPNWSAGVSVYGAATGDRGGFFAWGGSAAYRQRFGAWQAEAGLFVGGGGGSPGWVGSGLMLRPHAELSRAVGPLRLGVGVSRVQFPDGTVRSTQPYAALRWSAPVYLGPGGGGPAPATDAPWPGQLADAEYAGILGVYRPQQAPRRDASGGMSDLRYGGLAYRRALVGTDWLGAQPYAGLTALGAIGGGYDGYAELTGGMGLRWRSATWPSWSLRAEAGFGSAGAGSTVDTGGGLIGKVGAAVVWRPLPRVSVAAQVGRVQSRGRFAAREARIELAWRTWDLLPGIAPSSPEPAGPQPAGLSWSPWSVSAGWTHYAHMRRDDGRSAALGVVALKLERDMGPHWRLVTQATTAASGQAGGYATGHMGLGWMSSPAAGTGWRWGAEASIGAAGGGGVTTNGGLFAQAQLQARYPLARDWSVQLDLGRLRSLRGSLSSPLVGVSLVSDFSRLEGR